MVTGGFRSVEGMNQALESDAFDVVGIARLMAIDPDAPKYLLAGTNSKQTVQPIKTGIKKIDQLGVMEVLWYTQQLSRIAKVVIQNLRKVAYGHLSNQFYVVVGELTRHNVLESNNNLVFKFIKKHSIQSAF
jgi:hypothetical protein